VRRLLAGGVPGLGVLAEGVLEVKEAFQTAQNTRKRQKQAVSCMFWLINHRKCHFLLKNTSQDILMRCFFEEYINFKIVHYLSHCGVIPAQSFGSHIRPQLHRLGLRWFCHKYSIILAPANGMPAMGSALSRTIGTLGPTQL
jgi:hypothetical protein